MAPAQNDTKRFPLLPLRDVIIFPHMVVPLFVGREKSIAALEEAAGNNNELFLVTQKDASVLNPDRDDIYNVGTVVNIIQMLRLPDNTVKVLIEGKYRAEIKNIQTAPNGYWAEVMKCASEIDDQVNLEASMRSIKSVFEQYVKLNKRIPPELLMSISSITDPSRLADIIVAHLTMKIPEKQEVLEAINVEKRLALLLEKMQAEIEIINVERRIRTRVKSQMEKSQKEYYLNEQMNAIQKELGQKDEKSEIQEMEERLEAKKMPDEARDRVRKEIKKLKSMSPMSAEAAVVRNYVDWMLSLPWFEYTEDDNSVAHCREILEDHHYGMKDVKERIIEYLAVRSLLTDESKGTILCLAGPPGVGKTSIAKSLAESMGRNFQRISLGGVRDESEIRGHRRTYVGAMPGKIMNAIKKAGTSNPVILLDEIDKMSSDMRGDPASAMLEVLDPEQNKNFGDHYIEVEYDLSKVMFIMTANDLGRIPGPLRDRMEIINLSGYTPFEKLQIGKKYLLPKAMKQNGLDSNYEIQMSDTTMMEIIKGWTREAGVRDFERMMNTVARKIATEVVTENIEKGKKFNVTSKQLKKYLGPKKYDKTGIESEPQVGLVNGLAWTPVGGELLHIEVVTTPGKGAIQITGKLGEVMTESARAALSYVKSICERLGVDHTWFDKHDIHIHAPEGAIPKDGPSAGITMVTALTSAITGIKIHQTVAMTGEVTIRGRVLPIGGLKEKLLAAKQAGIEKVLIPEKNKKDLSEIPSEITAGLEIIACTHVEEVLRVALDVARPEEFLRTIPHLKVLEGSTGMEVAN
ncbi:MAG: endopeptidase La [Bacteriovoracaceae bacterium]